MWDDPINNVIVWKKQNSVEKLELKWAYKLINFVNFTSSTNCFLHQEILKHIIKKEEGYRKIKRLG